MATLRRLSIVGALILVAASLGGCSVFHELQWHRLWRMNYGPGSKSDPYYSVPDPINACPSVVAPAE